jgi:predicted component of type VI protein secretion system
MVRDKIQETVLAAVQKGTDLGATLPPEVQDHVIIRDVAFHDAGDGHLLLTLDGDAQLTNEQLQALENKFKKKLPIH